jgi:hypothetical protein
VSRPAPGPGPDEAIDEAGDSLEDATRVAAEPTGRERFSTQVSRAVQDRASLAQLTEDALQRHCADLEGNYHDGKPWPQDSARPLPPGRR